MKSDRIQLDTETLFSPMLRDENSSAQNKTVNNLTNGITEILANNPGLLFNDFAAVLKSSYNRSVVEQNFNLVVEAWTKSTGMLISDSQKQELYTYNFGDISVFPSDIFNSTNENIQNSTVPENNSNLEVRQTKKDSKGLVNKIFKIYENDKNESKLFLYISLFTFLLSTIKPIIALVVGENVYRIETYDRETGEAINAVESLKLAFWLFIISLCLYLYFEVKSKKKSSNK